MTSASGDRATVVSKGALGTAYLVGTGVGLGAVLLGRLFVVEPFGVGMIVETSVGLLLAGAIVAAAVWLDRSALDGERVWRIAQWCGVGIGTLVLAAVLALLLDRALGLEIAGIASVAITNVAVGGLAGVLFGTIRELREENEHVRGLNERNRVLGRVLRHNIRNEMAVVVGYADVLGDRLDGSAEAVDRIVESAEEVVDLGKKARQAERALAEDLNLEPVDAVAAVEAVVDVANDRGVGVALSGEVPAKAPVMAGAHLQAVVWDVVENAIEHGGEDPDVEVGIESDRASGRTAIRVADDGPGIPETEVEVLADGGEYPLAHGSGLGLWLVKWQVDRYGGELRFSENDPRGSVVTIELVTAG